MNSQVLNEAPLVFCENYDDFADQVLTRCRAAVPCAVWEREDQWIAGSIESNWNVIRWKLELLDEDWKICKLNDDVDWLKAILNTILKLPRKLTSKLSDVSPVVGASKLAFE